MATFEYKVTGSDTLQLGNSNTPVNCPGTFNVTGNAAIGGTLGLTGTLGVTGVFSPLGGIVRTYEKVTTTGTDDVIDPAKEISLITSGGAHTVTLANGTFLGQCKKIIISSVAAGTITITPANLADGTSLTMAEILDSVELLWDGTNWNIAQAAGIAIVA